MAEERSDWAELHSGGWPNRGAAEAYDAARLAFELGAAVRSLREERGWSQNQLAHAAGMTQSAVARFEAGGTVPTLPVLKRLAGRWPSSWPCGSPRRRTPHRGGDAVSEPNPLRSKEIENAAIVFARAGPEVGGPSGRRLSAGTPTRPRPRHDADRATSLR